MNPYLEKLILRTAKNLGWKGNISDNAPGTWTQLAEQSLVNIVVYSGGTETAIYSTPEVNYALRYWHDHVHLTHGLTFSKEDELRVAAIQCDTVTDVPARRLLQIDLKGQTEYYFRHKTYVTDQRQFIQHNLHKENYYD